jgi:hypothetical protein
MAGDSAYFSSWPMYQATKLASQSCEEACDLRSPDRLPFVYYYLSGISLALLLLPGMDVYETFSLL